MSFQPSAPAQLARPQRKRDAIRVAWNEVAQPVVERVVDLVRLDEVLTELSALDARTSQRPWECRSPP